MILFVKLSKIVVMSLLLFLSINIPYTAYANANSSTSSVKQTRHSCQGYMDATLEQSFTPVGTASLCGIITYYYKDTCTFKGCTVVEYFGHTNMNDYSHNMSTRTTTGSIGTITTYYCNDCSYTYND